MEKKRFKFYVEKDGFWAEASVIFMAMAIFFRLIGSFGLWTDRYYALAQIALPVLSGLLFILFVVLLGKVAFWTTSLPVLLGVAFFVLKSMDFESKLHMVLCVVLYVLVAVLYVGTVFTLIPTKWLLVPLFALPFVYHILLEDLPAMRDTANTVSFSAGMLEMSVLCIMLALLFIAFAMKKKYKDPDVELPKMKAPKVLAPKREEEGSETLESGEAAAEAEPAPEETGEQPAEEPGEIAPEKSAEEPAPESAAAPEESDL